jgi:AcrR family transcriptional regulator
LAHICFSAGLNLRYDRSVFSIPIIMGIVFRYGLFSMKKPASKISRRTSEASDGAPDPISKAKLLQSAELLFSAKGFRDVTIREIAAHAGVNSALISYYFRGKKTLFDEVFRTHADPLLQEGMKRLEAITRNGRKPSVEEILKAWILPWLQTGKNQRISAIRLRVTTNLSDKRWEYNKKLSSSMQRNQNAFIQALQDCLPHLSQETLMWRLHFVMSALVVGIRQPVPLIALSGGRCDPNDLEATFDQILPYAVAGFFAPETARNKTTGKKSQA